MSKKGRINPSILSRCTRTFSGKNWYDETRLERLLSRMKLLDSVEQELILDLTARFDYVDPTHLFPRLLQAFHQIPDHVKMECPAILVAPLRHPFIARRQVRYDDSGRQIAPNTKSADLIYELFSRGIGINEPYYGKIRYCPTVENLCHWFNKKEIMVFLDDFVGTGNTAIEDLYDIRSYFSQKGIHFNFSRVKIVCVIAMNKAVDRLRNLGVECYADRYYGKALSEDSSVDEEARSLRISMMKEIEKKVVPSAIRKYSLGYKGSEALVSIMEKSPNNTFPFYWYSSSRNDTGVIFPRHK